MPLEHLYDLPGLQIPEIDLAVFAPTDDVLPTRDEIDENRVRAICVALVCLHAARCLGVPKAYGGILCGSQYKTRIRSKLDM